MALLKHKKTGNYCPAIKIESDLQKQTKPGWVKFLLELGRPENASKLEQLDPKDRTRIVSPVHDKYVLIVRNSRIWLKPGMWLVNTPDGYKVYNDHMFLHYEIVNEVPDVPVTFNKAQMEIIRSLVSDPLLSGLCIWGSGGERIAEYRPFDENETDITQKDWLYLVTMLGLEEDIKHCTPAISKEKKTIDTTDMDEPGVLAGPPSKKSIEEKAAKILKYAMEYGYGKSHSTSLGEATNSYRYVYKKSKKPMQAIQINKKFVSNILADNLPDWVIELLKNDTDLYKPSLYWASTPKGSKQPGHSFRWRNCKEYNSTQLPDNCWIVRDIAYCPEYKLKKHTFYLMTDEQFKDQFISEKEHKAIVKCRSIPEPWSNPLWLPYTYLELETNKYVLVFRYDHKIIHTNFSDMPEPIRKLLSNEGYPTLDLCRLAGIWFGKLRHNRIRSMRIEMGTIIVMHLDADTFFKDRTIERLDVISQVELNNNYQKVGI